MRKSVLSGIVLICILLCGCNVKPQSKGIESKVYGVWVSCFELDKMLISGNFKNDFSSAVEGCVNLGITDVFIHTRPFCDSIYKSEYFPLRASAENVDFDVLEYIVNICHKNNIRVHAWINPYRVKTDSTDTGALANDSPVRAWLEDSEPSNDTNVVLLNGVYLNPASLEATKLVLDGIREIINNYDIDGVHFDDYFYPTESEEFDKVLYQKYVEQTQNPLSLFDWRRQNVNAFISQVNSLIEYKNDDIIFSISPAASVDKNYNSLYADIPLWIENEYIDWIMPQLYFGFNYPESEFQFDELYDKWQNQTENKNVKLIIGLANYKIDNEDFEEREEWSSGNLIKRQMEYINNSSNGCCFFSLTSLLGDTPNQTSERENIKAWMTYNKN